MQPFPKMSKVAVTSPNMKDATLRDFSGGLIDGQPEVVRESKFSTERTNFLIVDEYSLRLRFGTKLFDDVATTIVSGAYFGTRIIVICTDGRVFSVNNEGEHTVIWDTAIAAALPGAPAGWGITTHIDYTEMSGELIIQNNVNKPIIIDGDFVVTYLNDPASGSNVNTPIGKHITTVGDYCVVAFEDGAEIAISSTGTAKVWVGDGDPNDAIMFNLGGYINAQSRKIIGLHAHSNMLFVFFVTSIVIVKLGTFDADSVHRPEVIDVITEAGAISHRCILSHPDGLLCFCADGVYLITTNVFGRFERKPMHKDIQTRYVKNLPATDDRAEQSYITHDSLQSVIFFFCKTNADTTYVLAYDYNKKLLDGVWSEVSGWGFIGAAITRQKRLFYFEDSKIYQYGNDAYEGEAFTADYIGDVDHEDEEYPDEGVPIPFVLESPWMDANQRLRMKQIQYITGESSGSAQFMLDIFVDKYYKGIDGNLDPAGQLDLVAGSGGGFGLPSEGYGGGRRFSDERYHRIPLRCKIFKYRISGTTRKAFLLSSLSFIYQIAGYQR